MIPKIIHQIWLGPGYPPQTLMNTWRDKHPTWEYCLWAAPVPDMVNRDLYIQASTYVQRADILRYEILAKYGGVYIDADTECMQPIDPLCSDKSWLVYENEIARPGLIVNGMMGMGITAFMDYVILALRETFNPKLPPWESTGPKLITRCWETWIGEKPVVYPSYYFMREHFTGIRYDGNDPVVYGRHEWHSTKRGLR